MAKMKKPKDNKAIIKDVVKTLGVEHRKNIQARGKYKIDRATATAKARKAKKEVYEGKAELIRARQGARKTIARSAAVSSVAASKIEAERSNREARNSALSTWNSVINGTATPAEGTGSAQTGDNSGTGASTTVAPVGN